MIRGDEYIEFKERAKTHMRSTINSFEFWGRTVGRIDGQIKDKWGEARWYANLDAPKSLYELVCIDGHRSTYRWNPTKGLKFQVLDVVNNMSKFFSILLYVFVLYRLFFYNVAYWVAIAKNPKCASDIVWAADYPKRILFGKQFAAYIHRRNSKK